MLIVSGKVGGQEVSRSTLARLASRYALKRTREPRARNYSSSFSSSTALSSTAPPQCFPCALPEKGSTPGPGCYKPPSTCHTVLTPVQHLWAVLKAHDSTLATGHLGHEGQRPLVFVATSEEDEEAFSRSLLCSTWCSWLCIPRTSAPLGTQVCSAKDPGRVAFMK
jgi:hypothetical protein